VVRKIHFRLASFLVLGLCSINGEFRGSYEGMCGVFVDDTMNLMGFYSSCVAD